jgi:glycosyltransferase involved in cell wall biosynthesis
VITIGRGSLSEALDPGRSSADGHSFAPSALEPEEGTSFGHPWPARIAAERGIRRVLRRAARPPDAIHLRMADVGTLAAAAVASSMGLATVFSLAPDPHGLIANREAKGNLDRRTFAANDASLQLWYRAHLVERLAQQADQVALFPRDQLTRQLRELVGIDVTHQSSRFTVVPEGIDVAQIRAADAARVSGLSGGAPAAGALTDLLERLAALPSARHGLPVVLSVGRLNELKGMARLAEAFALDAGLRARATLVIVGGDLDNPCPAEAAELARIDAVRAVQPDLEAALVLLGHRPNGEVAHLLAAARHGVGSLIGPNGAYACASLKEEFGLAIVEALAAGLPVVAPLAGGPRTYVEDGWTGCLVETADPAALARGVASALDLSQLPGRAAHAIETMAQGYDIGTMASALASVYGRVASAQSDRLAS